MHTKKRKEISSINKIGIIGLISSFATAAVATVFAIYLDSFLENAAYVGFLTAFFAIVGVISYIFLIPLVEKSNKTNLYALTLIINIVSLLLFAFLPFLYVVIILGTIVSIVGSLRITLFGIIVRDKTQDKNVSKNEGLIYTLSNISWLISPVIAGFIASKYGIREVFLFAALMFLFASLIFRIFGIEDKRKTKRIDKNPLKQFFNFFKKKERVWAYVLGGGIDFWWALIYIYIPVYIFELGMNETIIGYFLGAVVVPLVCIEYYVGKKVGREGFKKAFTLGYSILGVAVITCFFISNIYLLLLILVLASFGAGMLEPTTEAYLFDVINKKQRDKFYGPYNTTSDINAFLGKALPAVLLLFFPFKSIFIFFGIAMFIFAFMSSRTKEIIENKR